MKRKVAFKTLGCRLNQYETDAMVSDFCNSGYELVDFGKEADVYIINTCTVTNQSDQKSKNIINQAIHAAHKQKVVVVTGCMAENRKDILEDKEGITYLIDNKRKGSIFSIVDAHFHGETGDINYLSTDPFHFSLVTHGFHTRNAVKIQDGCNNFCSYCIVPFVRGRAVSKPLNTVLDNIKQLIYLDNKEIVLTGVNISNYNYDGVAFEDLLYHILSIPGDFRIRISSVEPEGFTSQFADLFNDPKLCPHLHLCMQSGSDSVLKRMNRSYTADQFVMLTEQIRNYFPDFNFTTDIIVGFPGETDAEFEETYRLVKKIGFSHIHTFKYSRRTGTRADKLPGQVRGEIKNERSKIIRDLSDIGKTRSRKHFTGKTQRVLVEKILTQKSATGYGEHYIPVEIHATDLKPNTFYRVKLTEIKDDPNQTMIGRVK